MTKSTDSKHVVLTVAFGNEEDYKYVYKFYNNEVIFKKIRIWMDREVNNELKVFKNKLYLLKPLLAITPKQKRQHIIAYGTEPLQSPIPEMHTLSKDYKLTGPQVEQMAINSYAKETKQSPENGKKKNNKNNKNSNETKFNESNFKNKAKEKCNITRFG